MIPLLHDFTGERVFVLGGGPVAARRARRFAREASVVVVAPTFADADFGDAALVRASPDPAAVDGWLDRVDPALAVAATDDEAVNDAVADAARERGVLVNRADRSRVDGPHRPVRDVVVPATARDGPVVAAVATGGESPALSRTLRAEVEQVVEGAGQMAELTGQLRADLRDRPAEDRRAAVRAVVRSDAVWKALDSSAANPRRTALDVISDVTGDPP